MPPLHYSQRCDKICWQHSTPSHPLIDGQNGGDGDPYPSPVSKRGVGNRNAHFNMVSDDGGGGDDDNDDNDDNDDDNDDE